MAKANIHRRSTLEEVYPPDAFASDAAQNGRVPNTVLSGVRILSAPDAAGDFEFERATQQIGEAATPQPSDDNAEETEREHRWDLDHRAEADQDGAEHDADDLARFPCRNGLAGNL